VDNKRNFYFLEMNTRLQVEHPVTELVTGIDIVEQMIQVAAGEKLSLTQKNVKLKGWAIESRLYAEDPYRNFLPSIGRLTRYRPPHEGEADDGSIIRNDTGVFEGAEISMHYDPMVAKLCSWAPERVEAINAMARALNHFEVEGVGHNIPFLQAVMDNQRFRQGRLTTGFIAEEFPEGFKGVAPSESARHQLAAIAILAHVQRERRAAKISGAMDNHRRIIGVDWVARIAGATLPAKIDGEGNGLSVQFENGPVISVESDWSPGVTLATFEIDGAPQSIKIDRKGTGYRLRWRGLDEVVHVRSPRVAALAGLMLTRNAADTSKQLLCPMPGMLRSLHVKIGDPVEEGQTLAVVEAMKMENILKAERKGKVKLVHVAAGASLAVDELILEFE
jgi:propionyl-CoA carboxylase alpha chain